MIKFFTPQKQLVFPKNQFVFTISPLAHRTFYVYLFKRLGITIKLPGWKWRDWRDIGGPKL